MSSLAEMHSLRNNPARKKRYGECPLSESQAERLFESLDSIDSRLGKIEKYWFAGKVVFWVGFWSVSAALYTLDWMNGNASMLREAFAEFMRRGQ
jgi:hypothetical protein